MSRIILPIPKVQFRAKEDVDRAIKEDLILTTEAWTRANPIEKNDDQTLDVIFSKGAAVKRWWGTEILEISPSSVVLDTINKRRSPVLLEHSPKDQIGVIESAKVDNGEAGAQLRFSKGQRGVEVYNDLCDGIRDQISCGYKIREYTIDDPNSNDPQYRITKWEPFEISVVAYAADADTYVKRSGYLAPIENQPNNSNPTNLPVPVDHPLLSERMGQFLAAIENGKVPENAQENNSDLSELLKTLNITEEEFRSAILGNTRMSDDFSILRTALSKEAEKLGIQAEGNAYNSEVWQKRFKTWEVQDILDQMEIWRANAQERYTNGRQTTDDGKSRNIFDNNSVSERTGLPFFDERYYQ